MATQNPRYRGRVCSLGRLTPLPARHLREPSEAQGLAQKSPSRQQSECRGCCCVVWPVPALPRARNLGLSLLPKPVSLPFHCKSSGRQPGERVWDLHWEGTREEWDPDAGVCPSGDENKTRSRASSCPPSLVPWLPRRGIQRVNDPGCSLPASVLFSHREWPR